jgi:hypothetical protein
MMRRACYSCRRDIVFVDSGRRGTAEYTCVMVDAESRSTMELAGSCAMKLCCCSRSFSEGVAAMRDRSLVILKVK